MHESLPRRDAVLSYFARLGRAVSARDAAAKLRVSEGATPGFLRMLESLSHEGALLAHDGGRFSLGAEAAPPPSVKPSTERSGRLSLDARGFGFVRTPSEREDVYVPEHAVRGAMHGDQVVVRVIRRTAKGLEGEVVSVEARARARVAGTLRRRGASAWIEPDDARLRGPFVLTGEVTGRDGCAAVGEITRYPLLPDEHPEARLIVALGEPGDPEVEIQKVLVREAVDEPHGEAAEREARAFGAEVRPEELEGRLDLTGVPLPTIDPEDARDHDDAVWVERAIDGTYTATIAIADVSHYVRPGTALDQAALERGCSLYLPDRAIPMLPAALSSHLCSLLPEQVRLALAIVVTLDAGANVTSYQISPAFLRSAAKLTYGGVAKALGFSQRAKGKVPAELLDGLRVADQLAQTLRTKRLRRGALDLDLPEPKVVLDPETHAPVSIERRAEDPGVRRAYQLVEELMLLANEVAARFLVERDVPGIYRVHPPPDAEKLSRFAALADQLGLPFDEADADDPRKLSAFLRKVERHPRASVLSMLLLRALKQASYDPRNIGHFGLASTAYVHFTSPIRRYPDTVVHRIIKAALDKAPIDRSDDAKARLDEAAKTASARERRAMDVEREVVDLCRALYMRRHIGESFEGTVTSVVASGVFVALDAPFVDVLVKAEQLGRDRYELDEVGMRFVAPRSGDAVGLGDRIQVTIEDVSVPRRQITGWRTPAAATDHAPLKQGLFAKREADAPPKRRAPPERREQERGLTPREKKQRAAKKKTEARHKKRRLRRRRGSAPARLDRC
ncbi:MAG: ribonuclease R [Polyangiaceae bacterium]|nr:ribonuclease R [Polyangiaceae bacterium]